MARRVALSGGVAPDPNSIRLASSSHKFRPHRALPSLTHHSLRPSQPLVVAVSSTLLQQPASEKEEPWRPPPASSTSPPPASAPPPRPAAVPRTQLVCKAQKQDAADGEVSRRAALALLAGAAAVGVKVAPAAAAYGEAANVFGKPKTNTEYMAYSGDGFKLLIPSKWNPSREREYPGQVLRYEDNFDASSNVSVMITPTDKKTITDYGSPEEFLSKVDYILGKSAFDGKTDAEGGFESGEVATANILESSAPVVDGKQYYSISVLTRTADGDEGGKHQLVTATVADGKLYICKAQAGDKRWFKGARKGVEKAASSFSVA
ncbi:hypothetical protein PR202_ga28394 [Eleusine coracana subsp. coracana]|uniref:23 kDa subunit of oxygen evolving system of photosystem II n=1 Tax=Eleusine coracana subsp. coracana TaxID=191504 RepID=A0AAV5DJH9_ELECO|nr:hypothetical protein PR202_ga28394 [Eleusine coracana subsp. coracana]